MKLTGIIIFILFGNMAFSQSTSNMDWDAGQFGINLYQRGSIKYKSGDSSFKDDGKLRHTLINFYAVNPDAGWWIYAEMLSTVFAWSPHAGNRNFHGAIFEAGGGFSFNRRHPIKFGKFAELKIGMGVAFGGRVFRTNTSGSGYRNESILSPELTTMLNIKDRILVLAKIGAQPLYGGQKGGRLYYDIRNSLKLTKKFAVSVTFVRNTYRHEYEETTNNPNGQSTREVSYAYRFFATQFGIIFITG